MEGLVASHDVLGYVAEAGEGGEEVDGPEAVVVTRAIHVRARQNQDRRPELSAEPREGRVPNHRSRTGSRVDRIERIASIPSSGYEVVTGLSPHTLVHNVGKIIIRTRIIRRIRARDAVEVPSVPGGRKEGRTNREGRDKRASLTTTNVVIYLSNALDSEARYSNETSISSTRTRKDKR